MATVVARRSKTLKPYQRTTTPSHLESQQFTYFRTSEAEHSTGSRSLQRNVFRKLAVRLRLACANVGFRERPLLIIRRHVPGPVR